MYLLQLKSLEKRKIFFIPVIVKYTENYFNTTKLPYRSTYFAGTSPFIFILCKGIINYTVRNKVILWLKHGWVSVQSLEAYDYSCWICFVVVSCLVQIGIHTNVRLANPEKEKILRFWTLGSEKLGKVVRCPSFPVGGLQTFRKM